MRDLLSLLDYEAKRRPEIADLCARVLKMSPEEIDSAKVPLPWFRNALKLLRDKRMLEAAHVPAIHRAIPDETGTILRWTAPERFVKVGRSELLIKPGEIIFLSSRGAWVDFSFASVAPDFSKFAEVIGQGTFAEFRRLCSERLAALAPPERPSSIRFFRTN